MSSALPTLTCCPETCDEPTLVAVPGPTGDDGAVGAAGAAGASAFTTFTAAFTMPAELGSGPATVGSTAWMAINEIVYAAKSDGSVIGFLQVTAITDAVTCTLKNLESAATLAYQSNSAAGSVFPIGAKLCPSGMQGPVGVFAGTAAGGDLKGTYVNPKIGIGNTKGSSLWGNGTDTVAVPAGVNGHMLAYDSTDAEGVKSFSALPLTPDANVAENRVARLSAATGLPIPLEASQAQINPPGSVAVNLIGALVLDASAGNTRGTDAVDLQVNRAAAGQVASGNRSFLGAGEKNSATGTESSVVGGDTNSATAIHSAVVGGHDNSATADSAFVGGGDTNVASAQEAVVAGGNSNTASNVQSTVGGGDSNTASGDESVVAGGGDNTAGGANSTVAGGELNAASAAAAVVGGGAQNTAGGINSVVAGGLLNGATVPYSHIPGGRDAAAYNYGQKSHASGAFATQGDAQCTELVWRLTTLNAAPNKPLFLDGASLLAIMPVSRTWAFDILVVARTAAGVGAAWQIKGAIQNSAANAVTLVSAVTTTLIAVDAGITGTWGVAGNVVVEADNVNKALNIRVAATVDPGVTVRWAAHGRIMEIGF